MSDLKRFKDMTDIEKSNECFTLYYSIAKFIYPRLKYFRDSDKMGYPAVLDSMEEWNNILDKMLFAFDYALNEDELYQGLKESKYYYESEDWKVLKRKMTRVTRQINGLKGRIKQLKKDGYDTWDLEEKLAKLEKKLTV